MGRSLAAPPPPTPPYVRVRIRRYLSLFRPPGAPAAHANLEGTRNASQQAEQIALQPDTKEVSPVNIHTKAANDHPHAIAPEEWQARVDLAACYRLVAHH